MTLRYTLERGSVYYIAFVAVAGNNSEYSLYTDISLYISIACSIVIISLGIVNEKSMFMYKEERLRKKQKIVTHIVLCAFIFTAVDLFLRVIGFTRAPGIYFFMASMMAFAHHGIAILKDGPNQRGS